MAGTMHMPTPVPLDYWFIATLHNSFRGGVRNLGKPVALCKRYYEEGADEVSHPSRLRQVGVG